jgi:hypothetical protein
MAPTPVTIKIPATIPADSFAMGFFYDAATGHLEGMPLLAEDATSLTVATEHFSGYFGSLVKRALLRTAIDSGFRPGKDNWQFENDGSYLYPNGICAGIVLTEAWYYIERRMKGDGSPLYGLFDNNGAQKTPDLWQDDSKGYRLASVAHAHYDANTGPGTIDKFFKSWRGLGFDTLQYNAFRYAIAVTGEPQLVSLSDAQDQNGHAMLVYRVAPSGLFVADPNYPTGWRLIPFDSQSGKFGTYVSAANSRDIAAGLGTTYVNFVYKAKTALVGWATLGADWAAFDAGTIGDSLFPAYRLEARAGQDAEGNDIWVPLVNGYQTPEKQLTIRIRDPHDADGVQMTVYRGTSSTLAAPADKQVTIDLTDGENPLGILEEGAKPAWTTWSYVDFVRLTVVMGAAGVQVSVSPTTITDPSAFHTLKIDLSNIPSSVTSFRTVVDWGDGRAPQVAANGHPQADGTARVVMTSIYPPPNGGQDVTQITVSFQDANGNPLISCPEPTSESPSGGCRKWPTVQIPVIQPSGAPPFASASISIWMGHCQNCLDFQPGRPIRLVAGEPGVYTGSPDDLAAMGLAGLDLQVGTNGRTITSLRVAYADDPDNWFLLTNIPIIATITDPADQKAMSQFSLGSWDGIMPHLQWQANITIANGSHKVVTQGDWIEDPSSAGQEFLNIYLKQP